MGSESNYAVIGCQAGELWMLWEIQLIRVHVTAFDD